MITFEESIKIIDEEIDRKRKDWYPNIHWMDYDDVAQHIRRHIWKQWEKWDQTRPLRPWVGQVVSNQLLNELRNHYGNILKNKQASAIELPIELDSMCSENSLLAVDDNNVDFLLDSLKEKLESNLSTLEYFIFDEVFLKGTDLQIIYKLIKKEFKGVRQEDVRRIKKEVKEKAYFYVTGNYRSS